MDSLFGMLATFMRFKVHVLFIISLIYCAQSFSLDDRSVKFRGVDSSVKATIKEIIEAGGPWAAMYNQCAEEKGEGPLARACFLSIETQMELQKKVCSDKGGDLAECMVKQKKYLYKVSDIQPVSGVRGRNMNIAFNICSDLHGMPVSEEYQLALEYIEYVFSNDKAGDERATGAAVWYDYEMLFNCIQDTYKEVVLRFLR